MANFIVTPNMNLPNPVPTVDPGPDYADNLQSSLNIVDQHNHTSGQGIQIPVSGLNINAALPMNNNPISSISTAIFTQQLSSAVLNALFVGTDGNLYFNDGNGDPSIQITAAGAVNATSSGISSGTNTASFVSNVLVVNAATSTPANIRVASVLLGNNASGTKYLTLSPPAAMASNYNLVLPAIPASSLFLTLDTSGNFGTASSIQATQIATGSIVGGQLANQTITATQIANQTITATQISNATITGTQIASSVALSGGGVTVGGHYLVLADLGVPSPPRIIFGTCPSTGSGSANTFSYSNSATGLYAVTFNNAFTAAPAVTLTAVNSSQLFCHLLSGPTTTGFSLQITDYTGLPTNSSYSFIVAGTN